MDVYVLKEPRKGKLDKFYNGIFKVIEIRENNNVVLETDDRKQIIKHMEKSDLASLDQQRSNP